MGMTTDIKKSIIMILAGFSFGFVFLITQGTAEFAQYETAFFLEKLLSIDNLAVIATLFTAFKATTAEQHKALNYGIAGAIIMRLVFILIGAEALERYEFMSIVFGVILGYSGYKMIKSDHDETNEPKIVSKIRSRFPQISTLLMLILAVELTDLIFAVDSVPAVLSVTDSRMIAFTSNIMAILGLRALFFVLKDGMDKIKYLNQTLAVVLVFVGFKMAISRWVEISELMNMTVIFSVFAIGIILSLKPTKKITK
jgi:tellurite resistance protein TerC